MKHMIAIKLLCVLQRFPGYCIFFNLFLFHVSVGGAFSAQIRDLFEVLFYFIRGFFSMNLMPKLLIITQITSNYFSQNFYVSCPFLGFYTMSSLP